MPLTIHPKTGDTIPIEAEVLRPDLLAGKSIDQICNLTVYHGNRSRPLGEHFAFGGDASDEQMVLEGDFSRVKRIGQDMGSGQITIRGPAGKHRL